MSEKRDEITMHRDPVGSRATVRHSKSPNAVLVLPDILAVSSVEGVGSAEEYPGAVYNTWLRYVEAEWFPQKWTVVS